MLTPKFLRYINNHEVKNHSRHAACLAWKAMPFFLRCCLLALATLLTACSIGGGSTWGDRPGPKGFSTVVIDAGHGGKDSGARSRSTGQMEKTLALDIAQRLATELHGRFRVVFIRNSNVFVPLEDRVQRANRYGDGILLSIHLNSGPRRTAGPETYWWRVDSYSLARRLQSQLAAVVPGKSSNRGLVRRRLRLTRNPSIPCVLVECGYLSNANEAKRLSSASYRSTLARALAAAIIEQSLHGDAAMSPLPQPIYAPPSKGTDARE